MSKFIDKLKLVSTPAPTSMGFTNRKVAPPKPKMLLVASLPQAVTKDLADFVAGADAGLVAVSEVVAGAKALKKVTQAMPDIPWGAWLKDFSGGEIKQMVETGVDFLVFPTNTALSILQDTKVGKILEVESSVSEGLLRAVNDLSVDAVLMAGLQQENQLLTWQHLMLFRRLAALLTKPLLVSLSLPVTASELQAIRDAGVEGVIIAAGDNESANRLKELRQLIDKLAPPRRQEKMQVLLPQISPEPEEAEPDEEEEEEE